MTTADRPFPRAPLVAAAAVAALALGGAIAGRLDRASRPQQGGIVASRSLRFADRPDGSLAVVRAHDGRVVDMIAPRTNAFVRVVLHGLGASRRLAGIGPRPAFQLTEWADGRLTLDDPSTGRRIDLEAFGPTNAAAFATFLRGAMP